MLAETITLELAGYVSEDIYHTMVLYLALSWEGDTVCMVRDWHPPYLAGHRSTVEAPRHSEYRGSQARGKRRVHSSVE